MTHSCTSMRSIFWRRQKKRKSFFRSKAFRKSFKKNIVVFRCYHSQSLKNVIQHKIRPIRKANEHVSMRKSSQVTNETRLSANSISLKETPFRLLVTDRQVGASRKSTSYNEKESAGTHFFIKVKSKGRVENYSRVAMSYLELEAQQVVCWIESSYYQKTKNSHVVRIEGESPSDACMTIATAQRIKRFLNILSPEQLKNDIEESPRILAATAHPSIVTVGQHNVFDISLPGLLRIELYRIP